MYSLNYLDSLYSIDSLDIHTRRDYFLGELGGDKLTVKLAEVEVNLCVKVPISLRRHWSAEAKRTGVTMTTVIVEALKAKFGEPD